MAHGRDGRGAVRLSAEAGRLQTTELISAMGLDSAAAARWLAGLSGLGARPAPAGLAAENSISSVAVLAVTEHN